MNPTELSRDVDGMHAFLGECLLQTLVALDDRTLVALDDSGQGAAEGIVLRAGDRSVIGKVRFQDCERTRKRKSS